MKFLFLFLFLFSISCENNDCKNDEVYNTTINICVVDSCTDYNPKYETCKEGCITNKNTESYTCLIRKEAYSQQSQD